MSVVWRNGRARHRAGTTRRSVQRRGRKEGHSFEKAIVRLSEPEV